MCLSVLRAAWSWGVVSQAHTAWPQRTEPQHQKTNPIAPRSTPHPHPPPHHTLQPRRDQGLGLPPSSSACWLYPHQALLLLTKGVSRPGEPQRDCLLTHRTRFEDDGALRGLLDRFAGYLDIPLQLLRRSLNLPRPSLASADAKGWRRASV